MDPGAALVVRRNPPRQCKRARETAFLQTRPGRQRFDSLPSAALLNVVRFLSLKPRVADWASYVPADYVDVLLRTGGPLARAARESFRALHFIAGDAPPRARSGVVLACPDAERKEKARRVLRLLSGAVSRVRITRRWLTYWDAASVAMHAPALRHLKIDGKLKHGAAQVLSVLARCGASLEALEFEVDEFTGAQADAVAAHCQSLRRLSLMCAEIRPSLALVWSGVGGSLRELELRCPDRFGNRGDIELLALSALSRECRSVSRLSFRFPWHHELMNGIEEVCLARGSRLLDLKLCANALRDADVLRRIARACPKISIDWVGDGFTGVSASSMVAMAGSAASLHIGRGMSQGAGITVNLGRIGKLCANLQKVTIYTTFTAWRALVPLFATPKQKLVKVCVNCHSSIGAQIIAVLADYVTTLVDFTYGGDCPSMAVLSRFVSANRRLKTVILRGGGQCVCSGPLPWPESDTTLKAMGRQWATVVAVFLESPSVESIECFCYTPGRQKRNELVEVCLRARTKGTSVSVCGVQYA